MSISNWQGLGYGDIISTPKDIMTWLSALTNGELIGKTMKAEMQKFTPTGEKDAGYGLGLECNNGYMGHDGDLPGYHGAAFAKKGNEFVVLMSVDPARNSHPGFFVTEAMGKLLQLDH